MKQKSKNGKISKSYFIYNLSVSNTVNTIYFKNIDVTRKWKKCFFPMTVNLKYGIKTPHLFSRNTTTLQYAQYLEMTDTEV
jgi:hypothetical protein